jgi:putative peptidoglycan lipid II flippase
MNLFRSATTVGGMTLISRCLGFVRDMLIAATLGTGPVADAFVVAFRFPNLFRRLFGEGAFNAAFVPLFSGFLERDGRTAAGQFASQTLSVLVVALAVFTGLAELLMPWLIYIIAPGFSASQDKLELTVTLTRIAFPYLAFMSLVAMFSGVLNAIGRFAAAAAAPIVLNVVLIGVLFVVTLGEFGASAQTGRILVWGVSAAGLLQLVLLVIATRRAGFVFQVKRPRLTAPVKRLITLGIPGVIAGGITQVNLLIGTIIASLQASAVSYLYYADRVYQLPLGVVGVALGVVLLPDLSKKLAANDFEAADLSQNRALELSLALTVPASFALAAMPAPILQVLFERGAFLPGDTAATALALAAFAVGLPAFVLIKVFSPGFFARQDTKTPMLYAAAGMAVNVAGSLALFPYIGHVGIAAATSLAGWVNALLLWRTLARRGHYTSDHRVKTRVPRIIFAAALMALALYAAVALTADMFTGAEPLLIRITLLAGLTIGGAAIYFAAAHVMGAVPLGEARAMMRRSRS